MFFSQRIITSSTLFTLLIFLCCIFAFVTMQNMTKNYYTISESFRTARWLVYYIYYFFNSCYNFIYRIRLRVIVFTNALSSQAWHSFLLFFLFLFVKFRRDTIVVGDDVACSRFRAFGLVGCAFLVLLLSRGWVFLVYFIFIC